MEGVIFDLFGTIIPKPDRSVHSEMMKEMGALLGLTEDEFRNFWLSITPEKTTWNRGDTVSLMEYSMFRLGIEPDTSIARKLTKIWYDMTISHFNYFDDVVPCFRSLKKNGYKVGLLTNCGPNVPDIVDRSEIGPILDGAAFSTRIGIMKPHPESYRIACELIGTKESGTLFVGDGDSNELPGAVDVGLKALKIDRGSIAGDYRLTKDSKWDPTVNDLKDLLEFVQSL